MSVNFKSTQAEFAAYIRDPAHNSIPKGVSPVRMAMYHELFFNNIDSFLSGNFPVIREILADDQWLTLAQDFFANHSCKTPYFSEIAEEFLDYLQNRNHPDDHPFLLELAHYEWVEMALSIAKIEPVLGDSSFTSNILNTPIALSPLAWPLVYRFPVQLICTDYLPQSAPEHPTYLIVYRDDQYSIHFLQSSALTFSLLQLLEEQPGLIGADYLNTLIASLQAPNPQLIQDEGVKIFQELASKGVIIPADNG